MRLKKPQESREILFRCSSQKFGAHGSTADHGGQKEEKKQFGAGKQGPSPGSCGK